MKTRIITYLSVLGILLILVSQASIVYENYKETRKYLTDESNVIIKDAFQKELNLRNSFYKHLVGEDTIKTPPPQTKKNSAAYDMSELKAYKDNLTFFLDLVMNRFVSKTVPMNLHNLDSITENILQSKNIYSKFVVNVIDAKSAKVLEQSKREFQGSQFLISSKNLAIDLEKKKSLQLVLINPFASIFKQMGTLLLSSFLLSLFCFYGLWFLFRIQARQKKLIDIKNDFFGHTAHELKRPVAHLHMALEALSNPAINENTVKRERYLTISKEATRDMSEKITMIMTLSMAEEGVFRLNYSEFDLNEVIAELKEKFLAIAEKSVAIQVENPTEKMIVKADKEHLSQSIANLIDNAIRYSKESVQIFISLQKIKTELILHVKDNGIGIKPERMDYVFEKYTRLNTETGSPPGFGIGLSYVKAVVEKHAGRIELKSEVAKGSEFILYLPV